jgi:hypothetical protein
VILVGSRLTFKLTDGLIIFSLTEVVGEWWRYWGIHVVVLRLAFPLEYYEWLFQTTLPEKVLSSTPNVNLYEDSLLVWHCSLFFNHDHTVIGFFLQWARHCCDFEPTGDFNVPWPDRVVRRTQHDGNGTSGWIPRWSCKKAKNKRCTNSLWRRSVVLPTFVIKESFG